MRELWTNDVASYDGKHAKLEPSWQWPKPVQQSLRVWAGGGGRRAMQQAIDWDGGWMPMPSKVKLAERLDELGRLAEEAGKPRPPLTLYLVLDWLSGVDVPENVRLAELNVSQDGSGLRWTSVQ